MRLDRHESLGIAVLAQFIIIARHWLAIDGALAVLARHHLIRSEIAQAAQHLDLFITDRGGIKTGGRLHRYRRQQLKHVVLHHIAQSACAIIIADAVFQPDRLSHGDLDIVDVGGIPQRLKHDVGKAQRQQVLHGFLAEIVIDAENALFREGLGHGIIDVAARFQISAERLFQPDADLVAGQPAGGEASDRRFKQARRGGQEDRQALPGLPDFDGEIDKVAGIVGIQRLIVQAVEKLCHRSAPFGRQIFLQRLAGKIAVTGIVKWLAGGADDLEIGRNQLVGAERTERGQQHPLGEIAGGTKQQQTIGSKAHPGAAPLNAPSTWPVQCFSAQVG